MLRHILLVATMATTGTAGSWTTVHATAPIDNTIAVAGEFATRPPAPWQADDPADSLYRAGRCTGRRSRTTASAGRHSCGRREARSTSSAGVMPRQPRAATRTRCSCA
jgi:hypothetical protein